MNKLNRRLIDYAVGVQDERERQELYERMAVCFIYIYWSLPVMFLIGLLTGSEWGSYAFFAWLAFAFLLFGRKMNDLSSTAIQDSEITRTNSSELLKKARNTALIEGLFFAVLMGGMMKKEAPEAPVLLIFPFMLLFFIAVFLGVYCSSRVKVKKALKDLKEDD